MKDDAIRPIFKAIKWKDNLRSCSPSVLRANTFMSNGTSSSQSTEALEESNCAKDTLQIVITASHRVNILAQLHDQPTGAHLGQNKMLSRLKEQYYWSGSSTCAKCWCSVRQVCGSRKSAAQQKRASLQSVETGPHSIAELRWILWVEGERKRTLVGIRQRISPNTAFSSACSTTS